MALAALTGCGSTRTSNTARTATEQLLISDAIDRTVEQVDFRPLAGQSVYFDEKNLKEVVDKGYLASTLRQHMLASGCVLKEKPEEATFIVESRIGAVGTDNHDLLFGVPALQMPQVALAPALPAAIPEIPFAKRRDQRGVAKVAVFAYRRDTGEPVWQSGIAISESEANDIWVFGAGPFKRGTIYDGARFAGGPIKPEKDDATVEGGSTQVAGLGEPAVFSGVARAVTPPPSMARGSGVVHASAEMPAEADNSTGSARPIAEAPHPEEAAQTAG